MKRKLSQVFPEHFIQNILILKDRDWQYPVQLDLGSSVAEQFWNQNHKTVEFKVSA